MLFVALGIAFLGVLGFGYSLNGQRAGSVAFWISLLSVILFVGAVLMILSQA